MVEEIKNNKDKPTFSMEVPGYPDVTPVDTVPIPGGDKIAASEFINVSDKNIAGYAFGTLVSIRPAEWVATVLGFGAGPIDNLGVLSTTPIPMDHCFHVKRILTLLSMRAVAQIPTLQVNVYAMADLYPFFHEENIIADIVNDQREVWRTVPLDLYITQNTRVSLFTRVNYGFGDANSHVRYTVALQGDIINTPEYIKTAVGENTVPAANLAAYVAARNNYRGW